MTDIIIIAIVLVPFALATMLKSNAALTFLALCGSFVAISFAGADLKSLTGQLNFQIDSSTLNLIILALPLFITLLATRKSVSAKNIKGIINAAVAICTGGLLALIALPILTDLLAISLKSSQVWDALQSIQSEVIGLGVLLSLSLVWSTHAKRPTKKH